MSLLEIKNVSIFYGDVQVVYGVALEVLNGEVVSIIGANGAGKSTLLRCISGLLAPAEGSIVLEDQRIDGAAPKTIVERGIVQIPEGRRLFPLMSVMDNLLVGAYNAPADKEKEETLSQVYKLLPRLAERKNQLAITLSGGEQQMVAIGRGLMAKPKLLMLDEPSLGLAPILVKAVFGTIEQIAAQGTTVLLVEQDVRNSLRLSNRGYVLEHGRIALEGPAKEILVNPHVRTAYLGL
jgi:branched-chain amino acid transport system ATP-binding protein